MKVVVVGAGVSGAHAALTLLERGLAVELWDIGREEVAFLEPGASFHELKGRLADPIGHLLGRDLQALIPPDAPELLRYPPARRFLDVYKRQARSRSRTSGVARNACAGCMAYGAINGARSQ